MTLSGEEMEEAVLRYEREYDRYAKLAARVADICRADIVEANAIRAQVTFRAKSLRSFEGKLRRKRDKFASVNAVFSGMIDLAAVRVATYEADDQEQVVRALRKRFAGPGDLDEPRIERKNGSPRNPDSFYRAIHLEARLPQTDLVGGYANLAGVALEIQVCSMMAHVWNEIEHDLEYKPTTGLLSDTEWELLGTLGHLVRAGDGVLTRLLAATDARLQEQQGVFEDVHDFVARMRKRFPGVNLAVHAGQLFDTLVELKLDSPTEVLGEEPAPGQDTENFVDGARHGLREFATWLSNQGETRYEPEPDSSDLLLVRILVWRAKEIVALHPVGRGVGGPSRVAWFAKRYLSFIETKMVIQQQMSGP